MSEKDLKCNQMAKFYQFLFYLRKYLKTIYIWYSYNSGYLVNSTNSFRICCILNRKMPKTHLNVTEYIRENLLLCNSKVRICVIGMWTRVNDAIHVEVKIVKIWNLKKKKYF